MAVTMRGTMLIFRPMKRARTRCHSTRAPTLEELKNGIGGGYLELVPGFRSVGRRGRWDWL
jgi:hypothetical protein